VFENQKVSQKIFSQKKFAKQIIFSCTGHTWAGYLTNTPDCAHLAAAWTSNVEADNARGHMDDVGVHT
jgi:hypothetical protein